MENEKKRARSAFKRMRLSPAVREILQSVDSHGFRTYPELRETVLKLYEASWSWRIMRRLVAKKLLRRVSDPKGKLLGWSPARGLRYKLPPGTLGGIVQRGRVPKFTFKPYRDEQVRWVLDQLYDLPTTKQIITRSGLKERLLHGNFIASEREKRRMLKRHPDAWVTFTNQKTVYKAAIELIFGCGNNERLQAKLEYCIAKTSYDLFVFVCASKRIYSRLWRNYEAVLRTSPDVKFTDRPIPLYFVLLSELKADFLKAKFKSVSDEFSFGNIRA
jgi:hypothetical protein